MKKIKKLVDCGQIVEGGRVIRKNLKVSVCSFMVGIFLSISAVAAYAGYAESPWGYYGPILNISYQNRASISTGGNWAYATTEVQNQAFENVPTGYMGAKARMYNSSDSLVSESDFRYNSQPLYSMTQSASRWFSGTYYSKGLTQAWNGSGYVTYSTFQSPSQNH